MSCYRYHFADHMEIFCNDYTVIGLKCVWKYTNSHFEQTPLSLIYYTAILKGNSNCYNYLKPCPRLIIIIYL